VEAVGVDRDLLDQFLGPVLADELDAGLREEAEVIGGEILDGREDPDIPAAPARPLGCGIDPGADVREIRADPVDSQSSRVFSDHRLQTTGNSLVSFSQ